MLVSIVLDSVLKTIEERLLFFFLPFNLVCFTAGGGFITIGSYVFVFYFKRLS